MLHCDCFREVSSRGENWSEDDWGTGLLTRNRINILRYWLDSDELQ
jgi:hypothetical protein